MTAARRQYYYKVNGCPADGAQEPGCICWHDEGTGPLADGSAKEWRNAPAQQPAPVGVEDFSCCGGNDETPKLHCMDCPAQQPAAEFTTPDCPLCGCVDDGMCLCQPASDTVTVQQAWEWAGGNPGIKATREDLEKALRDLDAVCDDADQQPAAVDEAMTCPYCGEPAQVADYVSANLESYGKPVRARTECCGSIIRVYPVFRMRAETTEQGGRDDWGR